MDGEYELEYLLVEGHCTDVRSGQPPRGLQFTLGTQMHPLLFDTIVMSNLGYFQLKAYPGAWRVALREGRSAAIYDISAHENTDSPNSATVVAVVNSFRSKIIRVRVAKKPDKLQEDLLGESQEQPQSGIWSTISR